MLLHRNCGLEIVLCTRCIYQRNILVRDTLRQDFLELFVSSYYIVGAVIQTIEHGDLLAASFTTFIVA